MARANDDRWPLVIFSGIFTLAGGIALAVIWFVILAPAYDARDRFVEAEGQVISARVVEDLTNGASYSPEFELQYTPADRDVVTAWGYRQPRVSFSFHAEALEALDRFPVGRFGPVWYDPDDPLKVVLEHDVPWFAPIFLLIPLPFILIGLTGFAVLWRKPQRKRITQSPDTLMAVVGAVFLLVGLLSLPLLIAAWAWPEYRLNTQWIETPCEVLDGRILSIPGKEANDRTWRPEIKIRYQVAGQPEPYELWTWRLTPVSTNDRAAQQAVLDRYPRGAQVPCWYDPDRPRWAVLERDVSWFFAILFLIPVIFTGVGLLLCRQGVAGWRHSRPRSGQSLDPLQAGPDDAPFDVRRG